MKVLAVIKGFGVGGAERLVVDNAVWLRGRGVDYHIAYVDNGKTALVDEAISRGLTVFPLGREWVAPLRNLMFNGRYDIVHTHMPQPAAVVRLAKLAGRRRPKVIHTEHSLWSSHNALTRSVNRLTYALNDASYAVSEQVKQSMSPRSGSGTAVLHHGVCIVPPRPHARETARADLGANSTDIVCLTIANLRPQKDLATLVKAADLALRASPDLLFVIVGTGPLRDELKEQASRTANPTRVRFLGQRLDARFLLSGADLFVLSSRQEGLPLALLEAMMEGVPTVATRVGGIPEILKDGLSGLLVEPGDERALAAKLVELATDSSLREAIAAEVSIRSIDFSADHAFEHYFSTYRRILDHREPLEDCC